MLTGPVLQDPRNQLNFCISGFVQVECIEALYNDNPEIQNSVEIGDLADLKRLVGHQRLWHPEAGEERVVSM